MHEFIHSLLLSHGFDDDQSGVQSFLLTLLADIIHTFNEQTRCTTCNIFNVIAYKNEACFYLAFMQAQLRERS